MSSPFHLHLLSVLEIWRISGSGQGQSLRGGGRCCAPSPLAGQRHRGFQGRSSLCPLPHGTAALSASRPAPVSLEPGGARLLTQHEAEEPLLEQGHRRGALSRTPGPRQGAGRRAGSSPSAGRGSAPLRSRWRRGHGAGPVSGPPGACPAGASRGAVLCSAPLGVLALSPRLSRSVEATTEGRWLQQVSPESVMPGEGSISSISSRWNRQVSVQRSHGTGNRKNHPETLFFLALLPLPP